MPARADEEHSPHCDVSTAGDSSRVPEAETGAVTLAAWRSPGSASSSRAAPASSATTLARRLVDDNEVVAFDNLHRDALGGTRRSPSTRTSSFDRPTCSTSTPLKELGARRDARRPLRGAIAGVDTVLESPVRTMRVNLVGTYNALEAALATKATVERFVDFSTSEVFGTHAFSVREGQRHDDRLGRRGALDVRRLEARRRAHGARLPRRARPADA